MVAEKELIIKKANEYNNSADRYDVLMGEKLFDDYIAKHPNDIDMLLRLATYLLLWQFGDTPKAMECINRVLELDKNNIEATLLLVCIKFFYICTSEEDRLSLCNLKTDDPEELSMIEYAKSWTYVNNKKQQDLYQEALEKSVQLYSFHVWNHMHLARFYIKQDRKTEARSLMQKAIKNVKVVFHLDNEQKNDWTSTQEYFNKIIRGTHITDVLYESLKNELLEVS